MFIRIEGTVLNTAFIEQVFPNQEDGKIKGINIYITRAEKVTCLTFEKTTLDQFMEMVK